jgi:glycerophosphoryl diester phosphodiesterase
MIEFDVHKTLDDHIVVIHDKTTARTSDMDIDVQTSTLDTIQEIPLENGLQIPTLEELIAKFKGKLYFQIEIKQRGIAPYVMDLIEKYNLYNECVISSFIHSTLLYYKRSKKKLLLASLEPTKFHKRFKNPPVNWMLNHAKILGLNGFHPKYTLVTPQIVKKAHSKNLFLNTWTADKPEDWEYLIKCGVDGIMTNYPRELCKFLESR